jgi:hypothetical protein
MPALGIFDPYGKLVTGEASLSVVGEADFRGSHNRHGLSRTNDRRKTQQGKTKRQR